MKIAIDGPAGAGKSTIARRLAKELGFIYIDTGAMYRALTWKALKHGINIHDPEALHRLAINTDIQFRFDSSEQRVICDDQDVTLEIRSPLVSAWVSIIASVEPVREVMVERQQAMASNLSVIMDGRDIGECVLPDAEYKFFITASLEERAKRRLKDLTEWGYETDLNQCIEDLVQRDANDSSRNMGALKVLNDSIVIDTSNKSLEQVVDIILGIIREN
ncbi:MAG: (d)CMP kinase [Syntrophomonadaceae bacterium]|nr:(d)CMP kinase [Syntrophomonadaceae bacterium]